MSTTAAAVTPLPRADATAAWATALGDRAMFGPHRARVVRRDRPDRADHLRDRQQREPGDLQVRARLSLTHLEQLRPSSAPVADLRHARHGRWRAALRGAARDRDRPVSQPDQRRRTAAVIGPLVEMLAAVPSVIIGLWGIIVLDPFMRSTIEPALHNVLGFIPLFGTPSASGSRHLHRDRSSSRSWRCRSSPRSRATSS